MEEKVYSPQEVERLIQEKALQGWSYKDGYLQKEFTTKNWKETVFVFNAVASLAEANWHHPDVSVSFKKLTIRLKTHEKDGITDRDFNLASQIEKMLPAILKR
ncbi:MAG: 4a-hydroxytetrahydrobiopterin dehydratase [Aquificota bacterium]|nr:MAG: 4a-hydroxytetrahydrobiopterin dehydratase [Aquificota bacterium]